MEHLKFPLQLREEFRVSGLELRHLFLQPWGGGGGKGSRDYGSDSSVLCSAAFFPGFIPATRSLRQNDNWVRV